MLDKLNVRLGALVDRLEGIEDKLLSEDGLKTDVKVTLGMDTYLNLGATIVAAVGLVMLLQFVLKK